ncbi:hypothetical protein PISL3812_03974 [Talaromyces islandicus]|uniref:Uncharacterized protein n=1 Tax=Talaromyces islandicus TaxID=28573 RepID=A0A0U1LWC3_TALIS|nr:hypothetical protein PISL3812_03974 [Talaromyces islandicus]
MSMEQPPPPYDEAVKFQIRRKPIGGSGNGKSQESVASITTTKTQAEALGQQTLAAQSLQSYKPTPDISLQMSSLPMAKYTITDVGLVANPDAISSASTTTTPTHTPLSPDGEITPSQSADWKEIAATKAQKAFGDAKHFLGGLIARPSVSTKHYSIVRHSHGIVFYQGSNTFLAISIFADEPLPLDRTIWMQCKGWSGKTGMRAKALFGLNDSWLNVTPSVAIHPDQVTSGDERAWQRDIKRFMKKAANSTHSTHLLRQTAIIRIPVEATDGYYQFILCRGENKRKSLCTSPVFRVVSASTDPSSLRGASLSTLPLELGAWAGSMYARTVASTVAAPITSRIQSASQAVMPSAKTQTAVQTAYSTSGLSDRVNSNLEDAGARYDAAKGFAYARLDATEFDIETGPVAPYPVTFNAKSDAQAKPPITDITGVQKLPLLGVPSHISQRLHGHFFGWCKITGQTIKPAAIDDKDKSAFAWQQCIISASTAVLQETVTNVRSQSALKVNCFIRFVEEIDMPPTAQMQIRIMGFIRPEAPSLTIANEYNTETEDRMVLDAYDLEFTQSTLDRSAWHPDASPAFSNQRSGDRLNGRDPSSRSFMDKSKDSYTNARLTGQRIVGQIPFHRIGIRMQTEEYKDKNVGVSGFYIPR